MGTSQSSSGAPPGVALVPAWVPEASPADGDDGDDGNAPVQEAPDRQNNPAAPWQPVPIAPSGRFGPARTGLGRYARSGSSDEMRRGLGHYVGKGLGGAGMAVRRLGGTARTAGALYGALSATAAGQAADGSPLDATLLAGRSANEVMDAIVEAIRPIDGTQDAEASRMAIRDALAELLNRFADVDLLNLAEEQRLFAIERYVALDVYARFRLDVGKTIQDKASNCTVALTRFKEVKDYIKETVSAAFRRLRIAGQSLNARRITQMVRQALRETFEVFEDYVR
jgi:hypothetical protein